VRLEVNGFTQSFARLEMWNPFFRDMDRFTAAWIATNAGRAAGDGETSKTTNFNTLALHQGIADGVLNGFNGVLGITLGELGKTGSQLFN